jgi:hemoglobin
MHVAAQGLVGLHDFAAYCRPREGATTIRTLLALDVVRDPDGTVLIDAHADAFCHNQVRSMVAALLAVGEGRRPVTWPSEVLAAGVRDSSVGVAPAHGLTLVAIDYPPDADLAAQVVRTRRRRETLFAHAGGAEAFLALAHAHHARCIADPELNHPFSHPGGHPQHIERLAAYWGEVLGGPPAYSLHCSNQTDLITMHAGNGDMSDLSRRFVECFVAAIDDAGLPGDERFRRALRDYMEWAVGQFNAHPSGKHTVRSGLEVPHWDWNGLVTG